MSTYQFVPTVRQLVVIQYMEYGSTFSTALKEVHAMSPRDIQRWFAYDCYEPGAHWAEPEPQDSEAADEARRDEREYLAWCDEEFEQSLIRQRCVEALRLERARVRHGLPPRGIRPSSYEIQDGAEEDSASRVLDSDRPRPRTARPVRPVDDPDDLPF